MKYLTIFIYIIFFIVYGYSCHMTLINPDEIIWGYICAIAFGLISIFSVNIYIKYDKEKRKNNEDQ